MLVQFRHMVRRNSRIELRGLSRRPPFRAAQYLAPQAAQTRTKRSPDGILPWGRFGTRPGDRRLPKDLCRELEAGRELSRFCSALLRLAGELGALRLGLYYLDR